MKCVKLCFERGEIIVAKVITFGIQKGGVGKSTTSGIVAHLLAEEGNKVLVIDMDSQGNVTDLLTQQEYDYFEDKTILQAFENGEIKPYIYKISDNLHIVPSDDFLAALPRLLYTILKSKDPAKELYNLLIDVQDDYDYIIIDTPPSLSEPMVNAVCASDYVVILAESSKWAFTAIPRFIETVEYAAKVKRLDVKIIGILRTMNDVRRADSKAFVDLIGEEYPELVFDVVIRRKAATGRISFEGFDDNKELDAAIDQYKIFFKELMDRVKG
jgi:chromosome partitioning protein